MTDQPPPPPPPPFTHPDPDAGLPEHLMDIGAFKITIFPQIKTVCIGHADYDIIYELNWTEWIRVSDLLLERLQTHK